MNLRIGLIGHSLGGMIAPMVAAKSNSIAFVVSLAGLALPVRQIAQMQRGQRLRAKGLSEDEVRRRVNSSLVLYDRLTASEDNTSLRGGATRVYQLQIPPEMALTPEQLEGILTQEINTLSSRNYKFLHTYDPSVVNAASEMPGVSNERLT
jgi:hypothetical protein